MILTIMRTAARPAQAHGDETQPPDAVTLGCRPESYTVLERSDFSRYDNGTYSGHVYREVRARITPENTGNETALTGMGYTDFHGNFYVMEQTLRDMRQSARALDEVVPVRFRRFTDGNVTINDDKGFPALRGFPAYPSGPVRKGDTWTAPAVAMVDPLFEGAPVPVPFIAEYRYLGVEDYKGFTVHHVTASYALRYRDTPAVSGKHQVDIMLEADSGLPLMMRDITDDTYTWPGKTLRLRGFVLTFSDIPVPLDRARIEKKLVAEKKKVDEPRIDIVPGDGGLKLVIPDIHFAPDSADFLPEEKSRLDAIAETLAEAPGRQFLVEGHTAAVGRPEGEADLSTRRAKRMVEELVKRGIAENRFLYKGWGGTKPAASNDTDEGRRANRRVEITILE